MAEQDIPRLLHLPDELLIHILEVGDFQLKHFATLSVLCKRFNRLAIPYLYRRFKVSHGLSYKELDGYKKYGGHTRILEINYTTRMLTSDKTGMGTGRGVPLFLQNFPNITTFIFSDFLGISFNHFIFIIRTVVTLNLHLKNVEFHRREESGLASVKREVDAFLDKPMMNGGFAKVERLVVVYTGKYGIYKTERMNTADRMECLRRAFGRSLETVVELGVTATNYLKRPPEVDGKGGGYFVEGAGWWECGRQLKVVEVAVDCWPFWEMPFVDLRGEGIEELRVAVRGVKQEEAGVFDDVPRNIHSRFPNIRVLKIFSLEEFGADMAMHLFDLENIAKQLLFLKTIVWFTRLTESSGAGVLSSKKTFIVNRVREGVWRGFGS
ncbi:hypothetical protein TWF281_007475 [Arthrobotrys megalospora]